MNLDLYEQEILKDFEQGEFEITSLSDTEKERLRDIAKRTLMMKTRRVNIRLTEVDFQAIQKKAVQEGLPYQTLIASLIHTYIPQDCFLTDPRRSRSRMDFTVSEKTQRLKKPHRMRYRNLFIPYSVKCPEYKGASSL